MIAHIKGNLILKSAESVVIDVNGVGYEVFIPLSTFYSLPELNEELSLKVHTHVKEDAIQLYGFLTLEEKEVFRLLIGVSGVGPKLARNILSGISVDDLVSAIAQSDMARLSSIPGIGSKSAERLVLELKDKVKGLDTAKKTAKAAERDALTDDVVSALGNLGYKSSQAEDAVKKAKARITGAVGFETLLKEALKALSR